MEVKGTEYGYSIYPLGDSVLAEVYRVKKTTFLGETEDMHIHLTSREFGSMFGRVKDKDYIQAIEWAESHLKNIYLANK